MRILTQSVLSTLIKDYYTHWFEDPKEEVLYRLLCKYADRLPHRQREAEALWDKAVEAGKSDRSPLRHLIYAENPSLKMIPTAVDLGES